MQSFALSSISFPCIYACIDKIALSCCDVFSVSFSASDLGVVELHGVVSGQGHAQTLVQELSQRVLRVLQEQTVVTKRGHGDGYLGQVVQVLKDGALRTHTITRYVHYTANSFL